MSYQHQTGHGFERSRFWHFIVGLHVIGIIAVAAHYAVAHNSSFRLTSSATASVPLPSHPDEHELFTKTGHRAACKDASILFMHVSELPEGSHQWMKNGTWKLTAPAGTYDVELYCNDETAGEVTWKFQVKLP